MKTPQLKISAYDLHLSKQKEMNKKYVVRRTELVASYIVIDGAKNHDDAFNIFESMLESGQDIEFKDDEVLTSECEVLSDYESE